MNCAANTAFANRQVITHQIREAFAAVFDSTPHALGMHLIYDVAHNIAKVERRHGDGEWLVHRKGATRAFGPGSPELPACYRDISQPVICGGSMETGSLPPGRHRSRHARHLRLNHARVRPHHVARTGQTHGPRRTAAQDMKQHGILVKAVSMSGLAESRTGIQKYLRRRRNGGPGRNHKKWRNETDWQYKGLALDARAGRQRSEHCR